MFFASLNTFAGYVFNTPLKELVEVTSKILLDSREVTVDDINKLKDTIQTIDEKPIEAVKSRDFRGAFPALANALWAINASFLPTRIKNQVPDEDRRKFILDIFNILPHLVARSAIGNGVFITQFPPAITSDEKRTSYGNVLWTLLEDIILGIPIEKLKSISEDPNIPSYKFSVALWPESFKKAFNEMQSQQDSKLRLVKNGEVQDVLPYVTVCLRDQYPNSFIWDQAFYPTSLEISNISKIFYGLVPSIKLFSDRASLTRLIYSVQTLFDICSRQEQTIVVLRSVLDLQKSLEKRAPAPAAVAAAASAAATPQTTEDDDDKNAKAKGAFKEQLAEKDKQIKKLEAQLQDLRAQNQKLTQNNADLQKLRTDNQSLTERLAAANTEKDDLVARVDGLQKSFAEEKARGDDLQEQVDAKDAELTKVRTELEASKKDLADAQEYNNTLADIAEGLQSKIDQQANLINQQSATMEEQKNKFEQLRQTQSSFN